MNLNAGSVLEQLQRYWSGHRVRCSRSQSIFLSIAQIIIRFSEWSVGDRFPTASSTAYRRFPAGIYPA